MSFERLLDVRGRARARRGDEGGFTLIELIVALVILGIVTTIALAAFQTERLNAMKEKGLNPDGTPIDEPSGGVAPTPVPTPPSSTDAESDPVAWGTIFGFLGVTIMCLVFLGYVGVFLVKAKKNRAGELAARAIMVAKWGQAVERHMTIKDAYGLLLADPLAALTHSALWDINNSRTQSFHEAYIRVQDIYNLHGDQAPYDAALVDEYAEAVRKADVLWDDAVAHAEKLGYDWMPHQDKTAARRAVAMLKRAVNPAASEAERATAAVKAKEHIDSITVVRLKAETMQALETAVRGSITTGHAHVATSSVSLSKKSFV